MKQDNTKTYTEGFRGKLNPSTKEPFREAQKALLRASFADQMKSQFFDEAYIDILVQLFAKWLQSEPHAQKEREHYYYSALALGSVKEMLIGYEVAGKNAAFLARQNQGDDDGGK
jgi:hypothetical protein